MTRFLMEAGPLIWPIILLSLVIALLALWNTVSLLVRRESSMTRLRKNIDAIVRWSLVAAVLGFLVRWVGIEIWPGILLILVSAVLVLFPISLMARQKDWMARRRQSIDAVLFWGSVAAVLGFLGQWMGINKLTQAVAERGIVNPQAVVYGISESLLTPVAGMAVLVVSAFLWFFFRLGLWPIERLE